MNKKLGSTLIAMTIIIFMLFLTLGMFTKNLGGSASAEVASAQTSIVEGQLLDVNNNDNSVDINNTGSYLFSVKNTDENGNKMTEVKMKYKLFIETEQGDSNNPVPVKYQLYSAKYDDATQKYDIADETKGYIEANNDNGELNPTDAIPMELGIDNVQADNYILKFTPENDGEFKFKVKVESKQVD